MSTDDLTWDPPGPGQWYPSPEHMPTPVTRLFAELFQHVAVGWAWGAERYGLPPNHGRFGAVNSWYFYSPGVPGVADVDALDRTAEETLATRRWIGDLARWHEVVRPSVVAESRTLLAEDLEAMTDAELADHVERAIDHFLTNGPEHFASVHGAAAAGALCQAAAGWGLDLPALVRELAGQADAPTSAERLFDRIAAGLRAAGRDRVESLDEVRGVGGDAATALHDLLQDYGWRIFDNDLIEPTLIESPEAVLAGIRGALAGRGPRSRPSGAGLPALRAAVPDGDRDRFDELLAEARAAYGSNDDNTTVLFAMPLGLVRRAVLEAGRRLEARGRIEARDHALDAERAELGALLGGDGPSAAELAARAASRVQARDVTPPPMLGDPLPPTPRQELGPSTRALEQMLGAFHKVAWARATDATRANASIGEHVVRGRAVIGTDPTDALAPHGARRRAGGAHHDGLLQHDLPGGGRRGRAARRDDEPRRRAGARAGADRGDRRPRSPRAGPRRGSGRGGPDRRHHHRPLASHSNVTPA